MQGLVTRSRSAQRIFLPLFAGLAVAASLSSSPRAADSLQFVVPDNDGYGIAECMKPGMECGRVIADAWCEAHGYGHADAFGLSDDVTASTKINASDTLPTHPGSIIIRCND